MRVYEVEMCRTSYLIVKVEAESVEAAKEKAWEEVVYSGNYGDAKAARWDIESVDDVTGETEL